MPQMPSRLLRAGDGKFRVDSGNTSMITDPKAGKSILLDHLAKTARVIEPPPPGMPQVPALPGALPPMPKAPEPVNVKDLGMKFIEGQQAKGMQYTFAPPNMPGLPQPQLPPPPPTVAEVWTNPNTQLPVLTKITGAFGEQICKCKPVAMAGEPPASMFQIPPDYKVI